MPKKRNFLGGMQNYDPANGQYEPNLTTASGEQATPENVPGGGDNKGFQAFKKRTDNEDINVSNKRKHDSIKLLEDRYNEIKNKWVDAEIEDDEFVSQLKKFKNELDSVDKNSVYDTELEGLTKTIDSYISRLNKNTTNNSFDDINNKRMVNKTNGENEEDLPGEDKSLHIKSLEKQVSKNPNYKNMADSITDNKDINEAYFYGFKEAYEKSGYNPLEKDISKELSNRYWDLANSYRDRYGMDDQEWDAYGWADFEEKIGTEEDFIQKGIKAYNTHNADTTNNSFDEINKKRMGTTEHKLDISNKLKTVRNKEFGFKHYDLSEDILTEVYNYFNGDEDEMLDYLRNYDFGMTSGDLQGVIEVFRPKNKNQR